MTDIIDGTVQISLQDYDYFLTLKKRNQELRELLREEENKTKQLFGNFLKKDYLEIYTSENEITNQKRFQLSVKNPITKLDVSTYDLSGVWDVERIVKKLVSIYLHDMVDQVMKSIIEYNKKEG
jgi:hypothetical protein